jgi:hypothetical protein
MSRKKGLRVVDSYVEIKTKISGVTHDDPRSGINRQKLIKKYVRSGMRLKAQREPENPYDPDAVMLILERRGLLRLRKRRFHLGYLPRLRAAMVSDYLKKRKPVEVVVLDVTGGTRKKKTRGVNVVIRVRD